MIRLAALAAFGAFATTPAFAHEGMMDMPGMEMPETQKKPQPKAPEKKPVKKAAPKPAAAKPVEAPAPVLAAPAPHVETPQIEGAPAPVAATAKPEDVPTMNAMEGMDMSEHAHMDHGGHDKQMTGLFGGYAMTRDASGTAWQPAAAPHDMQHFTVGDWMLMGHLTLNGVYDWQGGPRGDEKSFVNGMIMGAARRDLGNGDVVNFRAMLAPDPLMGKSGYPLLLAAGETADGATLLRDRQHPHDLFMELSASYSHSLTEHDSIFVYAGLPGEPAFGPPAFMHRVTAMDSPEAPISHHWLDSTHVTFGVVTAGWVHGDWKIEASKFRGREPDEKRYNIETGDLDSEAVRVSWNPTGRWALQASWADLKSPEALHPDEDETRWSASAMYVLPLPNDGALSAMAAFGRKEHGDEKLDAWVFEGAWKPNRKWTAFARYEALENAELAIAPPSDDPQNVSRLSIGAIRDFQIRERVTFGVGGLYSRHFISDLLDPSYGGDQDGAMAFVRLKIS
ncbi:MAG: hypothetical protein ABWZ40_06055 [Caulobacterales bacterium]